MSAREELNLLAAATDALIDKSDRDVARLEVLVSEQRDEIDELMQELQVQGLELNRLNKELKRKTEEVDYLKNSFLRLDSCTQTKLKHLDFVASPLVRIPAAVDLASLQVDHDDLLHRLQESERLRKQADNNFHGRETNLNDKVKTLRSELNLATSALAKAINTSLEPRF